MFNAVQAPSSSLEMAGRGFNRPKGQSGLACLTRCYTLGNARWNGHREQTRNRGEWVRKR